MKNSSNNVVLLTGGSYDIRKKVAHGLGEKVGRSAKAFEAQRLDPMSPLVQEAKIWGYRKGSITGSVTIVPGILERACGGVAFLDGVERLSDKLLLRLAESLAKRMLTRIGDDLGRIELSTVRHIVDGVNLDVLAILGADVKTEPLAELAAKYGWNKIHLSGSPQE